MYTHTVLGNTFKKTSNISVLIYSSYLIHRHFFQVGNKYLNGLKSTHCQYLPFKGTKLT